MTPEQAKLIYDAFQSLRSAINCAADPHVDCRDEIWGHMNDAEESLKQLVDSTEGGAA